MILRDHLLAAQNEGKRIGFCLSGGGIDGVAAELGTLSVLLEQGIKPYCIMGTSAGALAGGLVAVAGIHNAERALLSVRKSDYYDPPAVWSVAMSLLRRQWKGETGYLKGEAFERWLRSVLLDNTFRDIAVWDAGEFQDGRTGRFACTSVNLNLRARWIWSYKFTPSEPVWRGIRASTAIPVVWRAVQDERAGHWHTDGGATDNIPVHSLVQHWPEVDIVLVITSFSQDEPGEPTNSFLNKDWTPLRIVERNLRAIDGARRMDSITADGRELHWLTVYGLNFGLSEPEKIPEAFEEAKSQAYRGISRSVR